MKVVNIITFIFILFPLSTLSLERDQLLPMEQDVIVSNSSLYVEGYEYIIKGIAYKPYPLGIKSMDEDGWGGGGLCSSKLNPFNESKSACYDFDIFDNSPGPRDRSPPGPTDKWFEDIWTRDFPLLKELGVNTIRIYHMNPITLEISPKLVEENWNGVIVPYGKSHKKFMELASSFDLKVIVPIISDYNSFVEFSESDHMRNIENIVREIGNTSSLLMFEIGNEFDLSNSDELELMNRLSQYTRERMVAFYNRQVPIMHCTKDDPETFTELIESIDVDIFCSNAGYRDDINPLFEGIEEYNYRGWKEISDEHGIPFYIGELGYKGMNSQVLSENPEWFNEKWDQVVSHIDHGCIGASYFEYNDEPYTQQDPLMKTLGAVYFQASMDGVKLSTDEDAFWTDDVLRKSVIFNSIKEGKFGEVDINYNTDIFEYIQRPQKNITLYGGREIPTSSGISYSIIDKLLFLYITMIIMTLM